MKAGAYRIVFSGFGEAAAGVVVVRGGQLVGGDSTFYYTGRLRQDDGRLVADIEAVRHSAGPGSAFGPLSQVTLQVSGAVAREEAKLTGMARQMPSVSVGVTLTPIAPMGTRDEPAPASASMTRPRHSGQPSRSLDSCLLVEDGAAPPGQPPCARIAWLEKPMSDLQLRLLAALWRVEEAPAVDLHEAVCAYRPVALSTVAHALADMDRRRLISHRSQGPRHLYRAEVVADQLVGSLARSLSSLADTIYGGDREGLVERVVKAAEQSHQGDSLRRRA